MAVQQQARRQQQQQGHWPRWHGQGQGGAGRCFAPEGAGGALPRKGASAVQFRMSYSVCHAIQFLRLAYMDVAVWHMNGATSTYFGSDGAAAASAYQPTVSPFLTLCGTSGSHWAPNGTRVCPTAHGIAQGPIPRPASPAAICYRATGHVVLRGAVRGLPCTPGAPHAPNNNPNAARSLPRVPPPP